MPTTSKTVSIVARQTRLYCMDTRMMFPMPGNGNKFLICSSIQKVTLL